MSSRTLSSRPTNAVSDSGTVKRYPVDSGRVALAGSRHVQRRVLRKDRGLQPAQLRAGVEPELLAQDATTFLEDAQRVGLASGAIQRDHQQPTKPFAQRVRGDERFELADHDPMSPELQLDVEPFLDRGEAQFRDPSDLRRRELLVGELGERAASPQRLGLSQQFDGTREITACCSGASCRDELFEAVQVDRLRWNLERIATTARRDEARRAERAAQLRHQALQTVARRGRGLRPPQPVDELISRHRPTTLQRQHHQERPQLGCP